MISDARLRLSGTSDNPNVPQTITLTAATPIYSTYYVDLNTTLPSNATQTSQNRDIGEGEDLYVMVTIETSIVQATAGTVLFEVIVADNTAGTTNALVLGSVVVPWVTGNTNLTAGTSFAIRLNPQLRTVGQRYLQMRYNATSNDITAGKVFADVVTDIYDSRKFYAGGFTVS
jgi:hypothetical protein